MQKLNNFLKPLFLHRFFLWNVCLAFGIIFLESYAWAAPQELYDARGKRDPFVPLVTATSRQTASGLVGVESLDEITLQGIVFDPKNGSMVIANDSMMKEGEEQGAVKVLKIEAGGALFSVNGIEGFKEQYPSGPTDQSHPRKIKK